MIKIFSLFTFLLLLSSCANSSSSSYVNTVPRSEVWCDDPLLSGFEYRTFSVDDDNGVATIIRKLTTEPSKRAILYIHGYNDYFFQSEMADRLVDSLYNFYAVDLRAYGRSIVNGLKPFQIDNLEEYFCEIDSALNQILDDGNSFVALMGHSTGGLTASLYAKVHQSNPQFDALILNSPFLDMNMSSSMENFVIPAVGLLGKVFPKVEFPDGEVSYYGQSIHRDYYGEWDFDTTKKFITPQTITSGWMNAIHSAHKEIQKGAHIDIPILLMHSDKSVSTDHYSEILESGDAVLDVEDIARYGKQLGSSVTEVSIDGGLHDLALSKYPAREKFFEHLFLFLRTQK